MKTSLKGRNNHSSPRNAESLKQDKPKAKHSKTHNNQINKDQTKEEDIGNLPDKEFQIMIVKMIQNPENKPELQINSLWRQGLRRCKKCLTKT